MAKQLGPTFGDELAAAGLGGAPIAWGATDTSIMGRDKLSPEQNATLDSVIVAHDSTQQRGAIVPFGLFLTRWTAAEYGLFLQEYQMIASGRARGPLSTETAHTWDAMAHYGVLDMNIPGGPKLRDDLVTAGVLTPERANEIFNTPEPAPPLPAGF